MIADLCTFLSVMQREGEGRKRSHPGSLIAARYFLVITVVTQQYPGSTPVVTLESSGNPRRPRALTLAELNCTHAPCVNTVWDYASGRYAHAHTTL